MKKVKGKKVAKTLAALRMTEGTTGWRNDAVESTEKFMIEKERDQERQNRLKIRKERVEATKCAEKSKWRWNEDWG